MISIIIPVYNVEKFIRQCLDSILSQSYKNYEVILIDDKSKDSSLDIIREYETKYSNFFVIENKKNSGPGASRNKGIDKAKGEYIMFIDSDDYIEPNTLEDAFNAAKKYDADVVRYDFSRSISNIEYADRKLYPKLKKKTIEVDINKGDYFLLETAGPCNKLFKRRNNIFDEILNECKNYLETNNNDIEIKNIESKISVLNNKKDKLLELVMEEYLSKEDYKKQVDLINEDLVIYQSKMNELKNNKKDKNYIENKINEIKILLEKCLEDNECYSDVFNELIDRIIVHKQNDKQIKLDIFIKTGESINTLSNNLGKKFHLIDPVTTNNSR